MAVEAWTAGRARPLRVVAAVLVVGLGLLAAPLARPVLPEDALVRYAAALGETPGTDERHAVGRLNQFFADMHGWRELAEAIARVVHELPAGDRAEGLCLRPELRRGRGDRVLRPAARPAARDLGPQQLLALGGRHLHGRGARRHRRPARAPGELFATCELGGVSRCADCMPYENGLSIWVARGPRRPLAESGRSIKGFI